LADDVARDNFSEKDFVQTAESITGNLNPVPFLFQTGYLTLDKITVDPSGREFFSFRVPNYEVEFTFNHVLYETLSLSLTEDKNAEKIRFYEAIKNQDSNKLSDFFSAYLERIPPEHHNKDESFYHLLIWGYLLGLTKKVQAEFQGADGYLDLLVTLYDDTCAAIEIKYSKDEGQSARSRERKLTKMAKDGLTAINDKNYARELRLIGVKVLDVGLGIFGRACAKALFRENTEQSDIKSPDAASNKKTRSKNT
jgi:hypothetical protein